MAAIISAIFSWKNNNCMQVTLHPIAQNISLQPESKKNNFEKDNILFFFLFAV